MRYSLLVCSFLLVDVSAAQPDALHPKQGLADMLMEYLQARYPGTSTEGPLLYISVQRQCMFLVESGKVRAEYMISTARKGLGFEENTFKTPTGLHHVAERIGEGVPLGGVLVERIFTGEVMDPTMDRSDRDVITTRILWLIGAEEGTNRGPGVDSHERMIYIHGTPDARSLGTPVSHGCIRMSDADVLQLYDWIPVGTPVVILDN